MIKAELPKIMDREFINGLENLGWGSIHKEMEFKCGNIIQVIPKTYKWYLMPPCFTLGIMRYGSRVKWNNPEHSMRFFHPSIC